MKLQHALCFVKRQLTTVFRETPVPLVFPDRSQQNCAQSFDSPFTQLFTLRLCSPANWRSSQASQGRARTLGSTSVHPGGVCPDRPINRPTATPAVEVLSERH